MKLSNTAAGRVGDLLAAAAIERLGGLPTIVRTDGCDIVAFFQGNWYRVEVKSAAKAERSSYQFIVGQGAGSKKPLTTKTSDILALVPTDIRMVYFYPVSEINQTTKRVAARLFSPAAERETWLRTISLLK